MIYHPLKKRTTNSPVATLRNATQLSLNAASCRMIMGDESKFYVKVGTDPKQPGIVFLCPCGSNDDMRRALHDVEDGQPYILSLGNILRDNGIHYKKGDIKRFPIVKDGSMYKIILTINYAATR